jgi:hypothetical protein
MSKPRAGKPAEHATFEIQSPHRNGPNTPIPKLYPLSGFVLLMCTCIRDKPGSGVKFGDWVIGYIVLRSCK